MTHISRRTFLQTTAAAGAAAFTARYAHAAPDKGRVLMLGFDGVEPDIVEEMMGRGELPNLAALAQKGSFSRLGSTTPPQSPVAWSTFATSLNPGGHGVYDFIWRDPKGANGPTPKLGTAELEPPDLGPDGAVRRAAHASELRSGNAFWSVADQQGARCKILNVPFAFPADELKNGLMLCGLGTPDLRGTMSVYFHFSDSWDRSDLAADTPGGKRVPLDFDRGRARIRVPGPRDKRHPFGDTRAFAATDAVVRVDRASGQGEVRSGSSVASLRQGQWSDWIEFEFSMSPKYTVRGIARFFPTEIGRQVRLYMSCVQFDPRDPYAAMSHPEGYAGDLAERYGLYKTIGWSYDTHAIRNGALAEAAFMDDVRRTMAWRERLTLDEIERGGFDLLASAWTATDRVGHMFWRFRDEQHPAYDPARAQIFGQALEETYRIMDRIVGNIAAKLGEKDLLMVFSDHGFGTWRRGVSVNNWLMDNGWMSVRNPKAAENGFLMGLDWSQTQAYAIGLSSLYLNVRGRETNGILPAEQRASKARELRDQLMQLRDSATGAKVFRTISLRDEYRGARLEEAPDLLLGYARGYQNSKAAVGGGISGDLFHPNDDPWSGDHVATSAADIPGMFFCNRPAEKKDPHLLDLAPTALRWLKLDAPSEFEGDELA